MTSPNVQSRNVAGLVGPSLIAMVAAELPSIQPHLYDQQTPAGVYGAGLLMFIAGLAIVRTHPYWKADWTVLVTLTGWMALLLGLVRMFTASGYYQAATRVIDGTWLGLECLLILVGVIMTWNAYRPART